MREHLGPLFNEGARQAWLRLEARDEKPGDFQIRAGFKHATFYRYMRGDRRPDRAAAARFKQFLDIDIMLWDEPAREAFEFPSASETESGTVSVADRHGKTGS